MNNTTIQSQLSLWECVGFKSSAVDTLWFGKAPNGHDIIACKWHKDNKVYAYSYAGIIETFMYYFNVKNSVGFAMASSKLRPGFLDKCFDNINEGAEFPYHANLEWHVPVEKFTNYYSSIRDFNPIEAIKWLEELEIISREESHFVNCMRKK